MPDRDPQYKKGEGADALPHGGAAGLNRAEIRQAVRQTPAGPPPGPEPLPGEMSDMSGLVFSGTNRPTEPITAGAPFGPGAPPRSSGPSVADEERLMAQELLTSPLAGPKAKSFAARVLEGR